ncbi:DUF2188 domain-containing protein [Thermodesulfobacteriota bacterium]
MSLLPSIRQPQVERNRNPEAAGAAIRIARNQRSETVIHRRNGKIRDHDSYGNNLCPPKNNKELTHSD